MRIELIRNFVPKQGSVFGCREAREDEAADVEQGIRMDVG